MILCLLVPSCSGVAKCILLFDACLQLSLWFDVFVALFPLNMTTLSAIQTKTGHGLSGGGAKKRTSCCVRIHSSKGSLGLQTKAVNWRCLMSCFQRLCSPRCTWRKLPCRRPRTSPPFRASFGSRRERRTNKWGLSGADVLRVCTL